jgi:ankyrin repeat protein
LNAATINGHLDVFKWIHENIIDLDTVHATCVWQNAVAKGHVHLMQYLWDTFNISQLDFDVTCIGVAAANGHIKAIKWLFENWAVSYKKRDIMQTQTFQNAVDNGHIDIGEEILDNFEDELVGIGETCLDGAAYNGHLNMLIWIFDHYDCFEGTSCVCTAIKCAAENGHIDIIKLLFSKHSEDYSISDLKALREAVLIAQDQEIEYTEIVDWLNEEAIRCCLEWLTDLDEDIELAEPDENYYQIDVSDCIEFKETLWTCEEK